MEIKLDKTEYKALQEKFYQQGYKKGYDEAGTFVFCKKDPNWKDGNLHMKTKSCNDYCLVCEAEKEFKKFPKLPKILNFLANHEHIFSKGRRRDICKICGIYKDLILVSNQEYELLSKNQTK